MKLNDINIRDPFIVPYNGHYYLYGTRAYNCWRQPENLSTLGFDVYVSEDLEIWSDPIEVFRYFDGFWGTQDFWAPEVHLYKGTFYMFATFIGEGHQRGTMVLSSDLPTGPFLPHSDGALTPADWACLDGTLYVDKNGKPFLIFCHEWKQINDGTICSAQLSDDLTTVTSEPVKLFSASEPDWADKDAARNVTDGPYFYRNQKGQLLLFWSSLIEGRTDSGENHQAYVEAIAISDNDEIDGRWIHNKIPFYAKDGGHGMVFTSFDGQLYFTLHQPNTQMEEHPVLLPVTDEDFI